MPNGDRTLFRPVVSARFLWKARKGGTLVEEHGESRSCRIVHRILRIVPGLSGIRKVPESGRNLVDKALGLDGRGVRSVLRNPKGIHAPQNA